MVRCIVDSLALAFAAAVRDASRLSGRPVEVVHLVGGGSQNALLCQLTADACGLPLVAGPVEATAIGNVVVQARTHGLLSGDIWDLRALIRATHPGRTFQPRTAELMRVALFMTCLVDGLKPDVASATVTVLKRLGVEVEVPLAQTCCGQLHINTGYPKDALGIVRNYVDTFEPFDAIVAPSGSCVGSVRHQHVAVAARIRR